jgi:hypothetical protein
MSNLPKYKDWKPTALDIPGKGATHEAEWFVAPCMLTRDSDALERSNWDAQKAAMPTDDSTYTTMEFGHWACGWFQIMLVKPDSLAHHIALEIKGRLEQYPVLDEELMGQYESEEEE